MQIHDLTRQNPATGSQLVFDTGSATYKALVSDVAKVIMEQYNGTTLAGSAQTPKAAIDALNGSVTVGNVTVTPNSDVIASSTFHFYTIGKLLIMSGWFTFVAGAVTAATTFVTVNKTFRERFYMPVVDANNNVYNILEVRENTSVIRARAAFTAQGGVYNYMSGIVLIN